MGADPFAKTALAEVPADFLARIPGQVMVASNGALLRSPDWWSEQNDYDQIAANLFDGNALIGSRVGDDAATALTDFRVHADGFSRFLLLDHHMSARQAGRIVQRVLEIDTYRMMALLALPVARALTPFLAGCESELRR